MSKASVFTVEAGNNTDTIYHVKEIESQEFMKKDVSGRDPRTVVWPDVHGPLGVDHGARIRQINELVLDFLKELSSNKEAGNLSIVKPSNGDDGFLIVSPHPINPVYNTILTVLTGSG